MACCLVGSLLMVLCAGLVRSVKTRLFRMDAEAPERWRLTIADRP